MDKYVSEFLVIALTVALGLACVIGNNDNTIKSSVTKLLNQTATSVTSVSQSVKDL